MQALDEQIDLLRVRLGISDIVEGSENHSFKKLMDDRSDDLPDQWYWEAFEELQAQGHLDPVSHKEFGGDACGRLSADGRFYLREDADEES